MSFVQPAVLIVTPAIGQMLTFFGTLFFMLLGRSRLRRVLVAFFDEREARLRTLKIMNDIEQNLTGYLSIVVIINVAIGLCGGFAAWVTGLPDPVAWAVLGFILNFIPYIGALIMEAALFMVGLVTFPTLSHALIAPLIFLALATLKDTSSRRASSARLDAQSADRILVVGVLDLAVGTGGRIFGRAAVDRGPCCDRSPLPRRRAGTANLAYWRGGRRRARHVRPSGGLPWIFRLLSSRPLILSATTKLGRYRSSLRWHLENRWHLFRCFCRPGGRWSLSALSLVRAESSFGRYGSRHHWAQHLAIGSLIGSG